MQRLVGVDVTRGLAVLGMFTAHVGAVEAGFWTSTGWLAVADGRSAATFATLAGLSAALLSGGHHPPPDLHVPRVRIAVRAVLIGAIGIVMAALGTPVAVILPGYAVMLTMLLPALGLRRRTLLGLAAIALALGPPLLLAVQGSAATATFPLDLVVGPYYPAAVWVAYLLVGLAVGRLDLRSSDVRRRLAVLGVAGAVLGYGTGAVALRVLAADRTWWRALLATHPHANTAPEVVGNLGVVLLVLVGSLVVADRWCRAVAPLAATGALALTAYCGHLVAIALLGPDVVHRPSNLTLAAFVGVTVSVCWLWRARWGRGPLERMVHAAAVAAAPAVEVRS